MVSEQAESLLGVLLSNALLKCLALVPKLNDCFSVGVEGCDRCSHAAGEGRPCHTATENMIIVTLEKTGAVQIWNGPLMGTTWRLT